MSEQKINAEMSKMMEDLDKRVLRDIQKQSYLNSAKCFDNRAMSSEQVQNCVQRCQDPLQQMQKIMDSELQNFQNRLQRCAMECQDRMRDEMPAAGKMDDGKMMKLQSKMESCVNVCVDTHIKLLPGIQNRIENSISQLQ